MTRWERWSFGILSLIVAVTGFVYLYMKYVLETGDPFAVINHLWQPTMLHLHIIASPLLIVVFGLILNSHILKKLRANSITNRRTGWISLITFGGMTLSGYFLQVVSTQAWITTMIILHVSFGVIFSISYITHLIISVRVRRPRPRPRPLSQATEAA